MTLVLVAAAWLGVFAHKNVGYSDDLWWSFALRGDAPRSLRAAVGIVGVFLLLGAIRILGPRRHVPGQPEGDTLSPTDTLRSPEAEVARRKPS